ncbi:MAG: hypothetical protein EPO06_05795 [Burkholderiaceae bacterium]|nr:MAG: hypothetical protein EPO06_05795 [Burkholderiaceae bacterium]
MKDFSWLRRPIQGALTKENLDNLVGELTRNTQAGENTAAPEPTTDDAIKAVNNFFNKEKHAA